MQERRAAAVVIGIFRAAPHEVIFVERAAHLRDHAGQIGLPGGRVHPEDRDLEQTALRELYEEVGVDASRVTILARLPVVSQRLANNFDVTPFVAAIEPGELRIDASETAGVFLVPLQTIVERGVQEGTIVHDGMPLRSLLLEYQGRRIWGLTARILQTFALAWGHGLRERVTQALAP